MSDLTFRNVHAEVADPVESWPVEALEIALERGGLLEWRRIAQAVRANPWGSVSITLEQVLTYSRPYGVAPLMDREIAAARAAVPPPGAGGR